MAYILRGASAVSIALLVAGLTGCASVNQKGAEALATAGQSAADALAAQADASRTLVLASEQRSAVYQALACGSAPQQLQSGCIAQLKPASAGLDQSVQSVAQIMRQRQLVFGALKDAYVAFADLVAYDARGEVGKSFSALGGSLDGLLAAVALQPGGVAVMEKAAGDLLGMAASYRKDQQVLIASKALHKATELLADALRVERDKAANTSLSDTMVGEQDNLYAALIDNGLVEARPVLARYVAEEFPGTTLTAAPSNGETEIVRAAAKFSYTATAAQRRRAAVASYEKALAALQALSAQHAKLEAGVPLDVATLVARANEVQQLVKDVTHT